MNQINDYNDAVEKSKKILDYAKELGFESTGVNHVVSTIERSIESGFSILEIKINLIKKTKNK